MLETGRHFEGGGVLYSTSSMKFRVSGFYSVISLRLLHSFSSVFV